MPSPTLPRAYPNRIDVRSFNLDEAIAASEKTDQQAQAECEQLQEERGNTGVAEPKQE